MSDNRILLKDLRAPAQFLRYELLEQIGAGGEGVVWSGVDPEHDRIVAIKLRELNEDDQKKMQERTSTTDLDVLLALRHPHVLPTYDYGLTNGIHYWVSPYMPGGSLRDLLLLEEPAVNDSLRFAAEIAAALDWLHDQDILHRDLKPSNILLDLRRNSYISDFGLAHIIPTTTQALHTGHGTPPYAPPEQHAMNAMTKQSDIFSFGVMLFEMLTGQLPWKGAKILGIQQLSAAAELPDPALINRELPTDLAKALRHMTDRNPASRPASAGEALHELYSVFGVAPAPLAVEQVAGEGEMGEADARELLQRNLRQAVPNQNTMRLGLTDFALVARQQKQARLASMDAEGQRFFLQGALAYGLEDDYWWGQVQDAAVKMDVASSLINNDNEAIRARVVGHLLNDPALPSLNATSSGRLVDSLIEAARSTTAPLHRQRILAVLRKLPLKSGEWGVSSLNESSASALAELALEDSRAGDEAARLIGQLRSITAVDRVAQNAPADRRVPILLEIQEVAGSLPVSVPARIRLTVSTELLLGRLLAKPRSLLAVFAAAFFGSAIGVAMQNYLIVRIPAYMDTVRISVSLERGLFLGVFFGAGICLIRVFMERFPSVSIPWRLAAATVLGGMIFAIGTVTYDILMVQIDLSGLLFLAGCLLAALGFALGALMRPGLIRTLVCAGAVFLAVALTWTIHLALLNAGINITPLFYYELTWSPWQIAGTMLVFSLPIAFLGNLMDIA